ncbi:MAG: M23 family metallopeptidase [Actinomycetaceae bacterium]|nr:M23 family metallopeptidase [Actinomycetaceae bacterium]MDY6082749.1 M23 family metallopeptidase [Actinomycetaceae bacterium]
MAKHLARVAHDSRFQRGAAFGFVVSLGAAIPMYSSFGSPVRAATFNPDTQRDGEYVSFVDARSGSSVSDAAVQGKSLRQDSRTVSVEAHAASPLVESEALNAVEISCYQPSRSTQNEDADSGSANVSGSGIFGAGLVAREGGGGLYGKLPDAQMPASSTVRIPLPSGTWRFTSGFGARSAPVAGASTFHEGIDLAAALGTPILAAADGVVLFAGGAPFDVVNNVVIIKHNVNGQAFYTLYRHMYADGIDVHAGQRVKAGDPIAKVGSNGKSSGPHLHFEVRDISLRAIDPIPWLRIHHVSDL